MWYVFSFAKLFSLKAPIPAETRHPSLGFVSLKVKSVQRRLLNDPKQFYFFRLRNKAIFVGKAVRVPGRYRKKRMHACWCIGTAKT